MLLYSFFGLGGSVAISCTLVMFVLLIRLIVLVSSNRSGRLKKSGYSTAYPMTIDVQCKDLSLSRSKEWGNMDSDY